MNIPVNEPIISDEARVFVTDALETGWISSAGKYVSEFEKEFSEYLGVKHGITVSNGTAALHIALLALGIRPGDEVIIPDQTIISCALACLYVGATPVLVDVDPKTGNIDPELLEDKITSKTKAIMAVHLFGHPADLDPIMKFAKKHKLYVVEDAAEAHGAEYRGRKVGSFGDISCFSFYGNKIITTGEGGMVVTNDPVLADKARLLKDLAHSPQRRFYHEVVGYNYRLTNLQAALGLGNLKNIQSYIDKKRWMAEYYQQKLQQIPYLKLPHEEPYAFSVFWMYNVLVTPDSPLNREELMAELKDRGIDTRTYFFPLCRQPVLHRFNYDPQEYPVSNDLSGRGFYLPSGLAITKEQINYISRMLYEIFSKK